MKVEEEKKEINFFKEVENRTGYIKEIISSETEEFIKQFIFLDEKNRKINVFKKIEKCLKYGEEFYFNTFENDMINNFEIIKKNKKSNKYFCISKEILKKCSVAIDLLEENKFSKELINDLRKNQLFDMCKIIYHSKKYAQQEGTNLDNSIVVCDYISFLLRALKK